MCARKEDNEYPGTLRESDVHILRGKASPINIPTYAEISVCQLKEKFISWLINSKEHPIKLAALTHIK